MSGEAAAAPRTAAPPVQAPASSTLRSVTVRAVVLALALLVGGVFLVDWDELRVWGGVQRTDDAVLRGDPTVLSARVAGLVTRVSVPDMAQVKVGDPLFEIDDRPYRARVDLAAAQLADAQAQVAIAGAQIALQERQIDAATAAAAIAESNATFAEQERIRQSGLVGTAALRQTDLERATANALAAAATLSGAQAAAASARAQLKVLQANLAQAQAGLQAASAALDAANVDLGFTHVTAPRDGRLGYRLARAGQYVANGTPLVALVPSNDSWVVADFRETQIRDMRPGQPARIRIDAYPGIVLRGHVDSIEPGSQAIGALLPPDRAVGNFTKITQRIPVKIAIDPGQVRDNGLSGRMSPGLSVEAEINTAASH